MKTNNIEFFLKILALIILFTPLSAIGNRTYNLELENTCHMSKLFFRVTNTDRIEFPDDAKEGIILYEGDKKEYKFTNTSPIYSSGSVFAVMVETKKTLFKVQFDTGVFDAYIAPNSTTVVNIEVSGHGDYYRVNDAVFDIDFVNNIHLRVSCYSP